MRARARPRIRWQGTVKIRLDALDSAANSARFQLSDVSKDIRNRLALCGAEGGLRWHRFANRVALDLQPGLDACGKIEARESLVDAPEVPLESHRLRPFSRAAQIVE